VTLGIEPFELGFGEIAVDAAERFGCRAWRFGAAPAAPLATMTAIRHTAGQTPPDPLERRAQARVVDIVAAAAGTGFAHRHKRYQILRGPSENRRL